AWHNKSIDIQKDEYEKQLLAYEFVDVIKQWIKNYAHLARSLADEFVEEEVLDILEKTWWDLQYEGGRTFREDFDKDPQKAMESMAEQWHNAPFQGLGAGTYDEPMMQENQWDLICLQCYHQVFVEMNERKIGISWCMSDLAAVRGWSSKMVMRFPNVLLRGAPYCHQIRKIVDEADPDEDIWTKEKSEKYGWRSIKELEE
ncbi:MAG: L-2-amino-thiazoline-4-carboxylic acid hydrolase, partial [Anaerolineaceae bacterium]|nr:L-2-amino-thiazoline-4-carboxylic acid hydrolase [Anaerolineaceae bacterium]